MIIQIKGTFLQSYSSSDYDFEMNYSKNVIEIKYYKFATPIDKEETPFLSVIGRQCQEKFSEFLDDTPTDSVPVH